MTAERPPERRGVDDSDEARYAALVGQVGRGKEEGDPFDLCDTCLAGAMVGNWEHDCLRPEAMR